MVFTASITLAFWLTAELRGPVDVLLLRFVLFCGAVNSDSITCESDGVVITVSVSGPTLTCCHGNRVNACE